MDSEKVPFYHSDYWCLENLVSCISTRWENSIIPEIEEGAQEGEEGTCKTAKKSVETVSPFYVRLIQSFLDPSEEE